MRSRLVRIVPVLFQFLPISIFVIVARHNGFTNAGWEQAFMVGGVLAVIQTVAFTLLKRPFNGLLAGCNLYLVIGAVSFFLGLTALIQFYGRLQATALFIAIFVVGLCLTFFSKGGFIDGETGGSAEIKRMSLILLAATAACALISWSFSGNPTLGGTLPMIALIGTRYFLRKKLHV